MRPLRSVSSFDAVKIPTPTLAGRRSGGDRCILPHGRMRIHTTGTALLLTVALSAGLGGEKEKRAASGSAPAAAPAARDALLARAKSLELPTAYVPPPPQSE